MGPIMSSVFYRFGLSKLWLTALYLSDLCLRQKSIDSETFSLWVCAGAAFALLKKFQRKSADCLFTDKRSLGLFAPLEVNQA